MVDFGSIKPLIDILLAFISKIADLIYSGAQAAFPSMPSAVILIAIVVLYLIRGKIGFVISIGIILILLYTLFTKGFV